MGVHGLWTLLEPVGKPIPLETLENKILAVDVSIWLHQATKGFRDAQGNPLPNAHLLGLCHRLCKLLFYKIKPIFVFDGGVPFLKRQTMASRQKLRSDAVKNNNKVAEKILTNYIRSEIINQELGNKKVAVQHTKKKKESDIFELPPLQSELVMSSTESDDSSECEELENVSSQFLGHNIHSVDFLGESFRSLPTEVQHEILLQLKDTRKQNSWNSLNEMPQEALDFSGFQMERLLKRRNLQQRLDEIVKEISNKNHEFLNLKEGEVATSQRMASDSSTKYVLIKKTTDKSSPVKPKEKKKNFVGLAEEKENPLFIQENVTIPDISDINEDMLIQEELFSMFSKGSQSQDKPVSIKSSSEDDSDFEEVPPVPDKLLLSIPIKSDFDYQEDEDIFADVFCTPKPSTTSASSEIPPAPGASSIIDISEPDKMSVAIENKTISEKLSISNGAESKSEFASSFGIVESDSFSVTYEDVQMMSSDSESNYSAASGDVDAFLDTYKEKNEVDEAIPSEKEMVEIPENPESSIIAECIEANVSDAVEHNSNIDTSIVDPSKLIGTTKGTTKGNDRPIVLKTPVKPTPVPVVISEKRKEELEELSNHINAEQAQLIQQHGKQERLATSITDQMYLESQEMLRLFGIPYLVAPMEAEAQCAFLDEAGITHGTITDDSDIWLFGGRRVYKNFFNQGKYVEYFEAEDIQRVFKLGREKLIHLALLTGSDYTEGVESVGPVTALEILSEFPSEGLEALEMFRDWLFKVQAKKNSPPENKIREKIRKLHVNPGKSFPFQTSLM